MFTRLLSRRSAILAASGAASAIGAGAVAATYGLPVEKARTPTSDGLLTRLRHKIAATAPAFCCCDSAPMVGSRLFSFGSNSHGQLGLSDEMDRQVPMLVEKLERVGVRCVSAFLYNAACVGGDGQVYTWGCGANARNGTGSGNVANQTVPVGLRELRNEDVARVAVGGKHSACVTSDGRVVSFSLLYSAVLTLPFTLHTEEICVSEP